MTRACLPLLVAVVLGCGGTPSSRPVPANTGATRSGPPPAAVASEPQLPPVPGSPQAVPGALYAQAVLADPSAFIAQLQGYISAVSPMFASAVTTSTLGELIKEGLGVQVAGVDWTKPMWGLLFDPNETPEPFVLVCGVTDEAALASSVEAAGLRVQFHRGFAAIGSFQTLERRAGFALSTLPSGTVPARPTLTVHVQSIVHRMADELDSAEDEAAQELAGGEPENAAFGAALSGGMFAILRQTQVATLELELAGGVATATLTATPMPATTLARVVGVQTPASFERLAAHARAPLAIAAALDWESLSAVVTPIFRLHRPRGGNLDAGRALEEAWAQVAGEVVVATGPRIPRWMVAEWSVRDSSKAAVLERALHGALAQAMAEIGSAQIDIRTRKNAFRHRKVSVLSISAAPKKKAAADVKSMFKSAWGSAAVEVNAAFFDDTAAMSFGADARGRIKSIIDRRKTRPPVPSVRAIDDAKARHENVLILVDVVGLTSSGSAGATTGGDPMAIGLGFAGNAITLRLTAPAAQVTPVSSLMF